MTPALLSVTLSGMTIECSQCAERIGGHDPKCVVDGQWWCDKCVYWFERETRRAEAFADFIAAADGYDAAQKRQAGLAAGEDV